MVKIAILGAGGGVGQPLALLLKASNLFTTITLYDRSRAPGVASDLSHISTEARIEGYTAEEDGLIRALQNADIVVVTAGPSVLPGITSRDGLLKTNSQVVHQLVRECARSCPKALILLATNPLNAIVPLAAEVLKAQKAFDPRRLFGVTTLDEVRAQTFLAEATGNEKFLEASIPVVGGHSANTIVALFSQAKLALPYEERVLKEVAKRVAVGGSEVFDAKKAKSAATLSTAYAIFRLIEIICKAMVSNETAIACAYVFLPGIDCGSDIAAVTGVDYFSVPIEFGANGALKAINPLENITEIEREMIETCSKQLRSDIKMAVDLARALDMEQP